MIDIFLKGIGLGIAVAAPVGPIGILCIRHTLTHGRAAGFSAGLGAATADGLYGFMVAAGLTATGVLISYANAFKFVGALLLMYLGYKTIMGFVRALRRSEVIDVSKAVEKKRLLTTYSTTFALTISNPMTILAFVGMIAAIGKSAASSALAPYAIVAGVFLGSALWWLFLVHAAHLVRGRLSTAITGWLDLVSGGILLLWGAWLLLELGLAF